MLHLLGAITQIIKFILSYRSTLLNCITERKETRLKTQSAHLRSKRSLNRSETLQNALVKAACPSSFPMGKISGSITVEAAIAVPLMIFALYLLIFPMMVMESERKLQNTMESVSKNLSLAEYLTQAASNQLKLKDVKKETFDGLVSGLEEGISLTSIQLAADTRYMKNTAFDPDTGIFSADADAGSDMVYIELNYSLNFPFSIFKLMDVNKSLVTNRRAWIGSSGGRGRDKYGSGLEDGKEGDLSDLDEEYVFVAGNGDISKVYHTNEHCHYISNDFESVSDASQLEGRKNKYGRTYEACKSCGAAHTTGEVYFTESGRKYHSSPGCKANSYSFEKRPLSELSGYHECTYCARLHT